MHTLFARALARSDHRIREFQTVNQSWNRTVNTTFQTLVQHGNLETRIQNALLRGETRAYVGTFDREDPHYDGHPLDPEWWRRKGWLTVLEKLHVYLFPFRVVVERDPTDRTCTIWATWDSTVPDLLHYPLDPRPGVDQDFHADPDRTVLDNTQEDQVDPPWWENVDALESRTHETMLTLYLRARNKHDDPETVDRNHAARSVFQAWTDPVTTATRMTRAIQHGATEIDLFTFDPHVRVVDHWTWSQLMFGMDTVNFTYFGTDDPATYRLGQDPSVYTSLTQGFVPAFVWFKVHFFPFAVSARVNPNTNRITVSVSWTQAHVLVHTWNTPWSPPVPIPSSAMDESGTPPVPVTT